MDLLEASKDDRNTQRDGPDAVYAPLHPLTYSWEVPRHYHTFQKVISKGDIKILKYEYWHYFYMNTVSPFCLVVVILIKYNGSFSWQSFRKWTWKKNNQSFHNFCWWKNLKQWNSYVIKLLACVTESGMLLLWWFNFAIRIFLTINSVRLTSRWQSLCIIGGYLILDLNCFISSFPFGCWFSFIILKMIKIKPSTF